MESFELKTVVAAPPHRVFAAVTDPKKIARWDHCTFVRNDLRLAGRLRKRDAEGHLSDSEIVAFDPPYRFAVVSPLPVNPDEPEMPELMVNLPATLTTGLLKVSPSPARVTVPSSTVKPPAVWPPLRVTV